MKRSAPASSSKATTSTKKAKTSRIEAVPANLFLDADKDFLAKSDLPWRIFSDEDLPGAEVYYLPNFLEKDYANELLAEFEKLDTWYRPTLKVYGKSITQSRAIAAYSTTPGLFFKYSGTVVDMHHPYPDHLMNVQRKVEDVLGLGFNHVMMNRYEDGSVYIGRHSDTKENNVIASLTLGAERTFVMTPAKKSQSSKVKPVKWTLGNGSLLVMQGDTQLNWKHEIPKEARVKGSRISLTFRQIQQADLEK
ncbi:hypothetical protein DL93DRAFT_2206397 [Clavulina sp. PMI_390]|nr:hypothetical protein DL93DRAFT_2206397 [Clavulina sp. PMI_390]